MYRYSFVILWGLFLMGATAVGRAGEADSPDESKVTEKSVEAGPTTEDEPEFSVICEPVEVAFDRALAYLEKNEPSSVEDAFVMSHLLEDIEREGLEEFVQKGREKFKDDPSIWYLVAGSPRIAIPATLPKGRELYDLITSTPHADPPRRSFDLIIDFFVTPHQGYLLTHQVFMLEVAKSRGIELPPTIFPNGSQFISKIYLEQREDTQFSDLYARRTLMLLLYSVPPEELARNWVNIVLAAQQEDGSWSDSKPYDLELDGEAFTITPDPVSTTVMATFAVSAFRKHFCLPVEEVVVK